MEILTQACAELSIKFNSNGTYTARVGVQEQTFDNLQDAYEWAVELRDGRKDAHTV